MGVTDARSRLASGPWIVLTGFFDPLTVTQAKRVHAARQAGSKLAAIVLDREDALLPIEARAALVAALRDVDLVITSRDHEWQAVLANVSNIHLIDDPEGERARSAEFVRIVLERQKSA